MFWLCGTVFYLQNIPKKLWTPTNTYKHYWIEKDCKETKASKHKSRKITELQRNTINFLHMQKKHISRIYLTNDVCWCCILHFGESCGIMIIMANQSIPRAFSHYSVIRSGIHRRLCTRARFQSCVLSSLHSSNQRLWGLGGYLPRSTCALGPCQQHDANFW